MSCQRCKSERVAHVTGKTSDMCSVGVGENHHDGYVPNDMRIGGGDYLELSFCLYCGQIQAAFPAPISSLESGGA